MQKRLYDGKFARRYIKYVNFIRRVYGNGLVPCNTEVLVNDLISSLNLITRGCLFLIVLVKQKRLSLGFDIENLFNGL